MRILTITAFCAITLIFSGCADNSHGGNPNVNNPSSHNPLLPKSSYQSNTEVPS